MNILLIYLIIGLIISMSYYIKKENASAITALFIILLWPIFLIYLLLASKEEKKNDCGC